MRRNYKDFYTAKKVQQIKIRRREAHSDWEELVGSESRVGKDATDSSEH